MQLKPLTPNQSLNKAYRKEKVGRADIELFKTNLKAFLASINEQESEEHTKNNITEFLKLTYYQGKNQINTKGRIDLAIYEDKKPVVIFEAKRPDSADMVSKADLNKKALHELILYYLRERIDETNTDIKYLIATDMYQWFVFDATVFDRLFIQNNQFTKDYIDWRDGRKSDNTTDFFYSSIAKPFLTKSKEEIPFTWFDLRDFQTVISNADSKDDVKLVPLYKLLSPAHLLKQPFANDSNSLDTKFYSELLHIIGLEEKKDGGKKLIQRKEKPDPGSLLENAINVLTAEDRLHKLPREGADFGEKKDEQLFNVALELCITWVNRILFLKLLEGQLLNYHSGNEQYRFLNFKTIPNYDELNKLFFQVLARRHAERTVAIQEKYKVIPYLNSSLFDISSLEDDTLRINSLDDSIKLKIFKSTVLKDNAKKKEGELPTLQYLFEFLNAYDFTSEGKEEIQEENKSLINASVLGLIFEKINGYKDGSFFTPGFITMYMCREAIRRAVLQKFKEVKGWELETFNQLHNQITARNVDEANKIINSLKICDPAVGSGHFLVSALNEIISIKSELGVLADRNGKVLRDYSVEVINDELIVSLGLNEFFEYKPGNKESQRVQEALFHEKQTLIENCLFGVDINPNSVKICRLRLWIELLKNAYYTTESKFSELETLPNIDINIKQGNSLISRFPLDADLTKALKSIKYSIDDYRGFVNDYKNATDKEAKRGFEKLIEQIKKDFRTEIGKNDPKVQLLNKKSGELFNLLNQARVFEPTEKEKKDRAKQKERLELEISKLATDIEEIKHSAIYKDAFEWRFEFPEVLDREGRFNGFDVIIGNPPYIRHEEFVPLKLHLASTFKVFAGTSDLYVYFIELGSMLLKSNGDFGFIVPNKWMRAGYGKALRNFVKDLEIQEIIDFGDLPVFEEATTYPLILRFNKTKSENSFNAVNIASLALASDLFLFVRNNKIAIKKEQLREDGWTLIGDSNLDLLNKLRTSGKSLKDYVNGQIYYGIKTGLNEAFVIDEVTKAQLIGEDPNCIDLIKPFLAGRDVKRYLQPRKVNYLILFKSGDTKKWFGVEDEKQSWDLLSKKFPSVCKHLSLFENDARKRYDQGDFWWELRPCDYYQEFERSKIIIPAIVKSASYAFDQHSFYSNDKTSIIPTDDLYLLGLLNSRTLDYFLKSIASTKQNGYYEYKPVYISQLPIIEPTITQREKIAELASQIVETRKVDGSTSTIDLESQLDQLTYQLYQLTQEEIKIIEGT